MKPSRGGERAGKADWGWRETGGGSGESLGAGKVRSREKRNQN